MEKKKTGRKPELFKIEGFSFDEALAAMVNKPSKKIKPKKEKDKENKKK